MLGPVLKEKAQAEAYLANSGLAYTVIRPGGLVSESATGQEVLTERSKGGWLYSSGSGSDAYGSLLE